MKKYFNFAYVGAIALLGAGGFTACSSDDALVEDQPQVQQTAPDSPFYNPKTGEVGVEFVMNVSSGNGGTRMTEANTQATLSNDFRGIDNALIATFIQKDGENFDDGKWITSAITAGKTYNLGEIMSAGYLDPDGSGSTPKSRRVVELALPTGTNTLMFWGKAIKNGTDKAQGSIAFTTDKNLSNISFTLNRRIPAASEDAFTQYKNLIAAVMTKLVDTKDQYTGTYASVDYDITLGWKDYVTYDGENNKLIVREKTPAVADEDMDPLGEILAEAFIALNTIWPNELRAGAGPAVARTLGDLYEVLHEVAQATPTSKAETISKAVASKLTGRLGNLIDTGSKLWKSDLGTIKEFAGAGAYDLVTGNLNDFPMTPFNVPQGATILQITIANPTVDADRSFTYSYKTEIPTYAMSGGPGGSFNPLNYRYPAELCYFGNSPVRVTNDAHTTTQYPDGVANWDNDASWAAGATGTGSEAWTKNGHVLSSTRSVAMQQNINYGTALLKTTVRYGASTLYDNNEAIQARYGATEPNNQFTPAEAGFTLTGILIGGVEAEMGWNYLAKAGEPLFKSYIYDNDLPSTAIPTNGDKSTANYTLLWDNWNQANKGSKQNVVYIALEFVNNSGKDFWGMNNLIRNGATFYITGKLDPDVATEEKLSALGKTAEQYAADKSLGITWPTKYALPPYESDGSTVKERRIFIQDYMTEANFTIGATSLQSALIAVPDLRSSQISLGLSVDLQWSTGLSFESTLGE